MTYDVMTYDLITYDVMTYELITYDVMTYDVLTSCIVHQKMRTTQKIKNDLNEKYVKMQTT